MRESTTFTGISGAEDLLSCSVEKSKQAEEAKTIRKKHAGERLSLNLRNGAGKPLPIEMSHSLTERLAQPPIQIQLQALASITVTDIVILRFAMWSL